MKIPYSINPLVIDVFKRSEEASTLVSENGILIDAQDLDWDNGEIPTLAALCTRKIAFYFADYPFYYEVPCSDRDYLLELLSLDLDLEITIPLLKSEYYWKRRYEKYFGAIVHPKPKVWNWKSICIEREVQRIIETAEPSSRGEEKIEDTLKLCAPYVRRLIISQLMMWRPPFGCPPADIPEIWPTEHIDFTYILVHLPLVEEIDIVFGMNNVAFDFCWDMLKVTYNDCEKLGRAILSLTDLKVLRIHKSKIEDRQCQGLMKSLVHNKTIVELDLSNCKIGDEGALCIASFLLNCVSLRILNLNNNFIRERGTVGLAYALIQDRCPRLKVLDLSLNPLGREGVVGIGRALIRCDIPTELSISAVQFDGDVIERICQMLTVNNSLKVLDLSTNYFGEDGGNMLIEAMEHHTSLEFIDMRDTGITNEQLLSLKKLLSRNSGVPIDLEEEDDELKVQLADDTKQPDEEEDDI